MNNSVLSSGQSSTVTFNSTNNYGTSQHSSKFNILEHLDKLTPVEGKGKQSPSQAEYHCPVCGAENFKVNLKTGKYNAFSCDCNTGVTNKQPFIRAITGEPARSPRNTGVTPVHKKKPAVATTSSGKEADTPHPTIKKVPKQAGETRYTYHLLSENTLLDKVSREDLDSYLDDWVKVHRKDDGKGNKEVRMNPTGVDTSRAVPYKIERLMRFADTHTLYITEGERTADTLNNYFSERKINGVATTNIGGAGKWRESLTDIITKLDFHRIVLCPDGDTVGFNHMVEVYRQFEAKDIKCGWLLSDNRPYNELPEKKGIDMSDIVDGGHLDDDFDLEEALASPEDIAWLNRLLSLTTEEDEDDIDDDDAILAKWLPSSIDAWFSKPTKGNWLIEDLVASGSTMVASASNLGKSILVTQIAMAIITGEDILGCNVNRQGKVIYHASDEGEDILKGRLAKQGLPSSPYRDDFIPLICDTDGVYWDLSMLPVLEKIFRKQKPVAYIMDSLSSAINPLGITELDAKVLQYINQLRKLCEQYSVALIMIHHTRKNTTGGLNDVSGSGSIVRPFDVVHVMTEDSRNGGQARKLTLEKSRTSPRGTKKHLLLDGDTLSFTINDSASEGDDEDTSEKKVSVKDKIIDFLSSSGDWHSLDDLEINLDLPRKTITSELSRLKKDGRVINNGSGNYRMCDPNH